jgi:DNA-binding CsgD family transcriptional regulator
VQALLPEGLSDLLDAAASASSWADYERPLFDWLARVIGFDVAFCVRGDGLGPHAPGFDPRVRRSTLGRYAAFGCEYAGLKQAALRDRGAIVDLDYFGRSALERTLTYREVIGPHRGRSSLLLFLEADRPLATLVLGRTRGEFRAREREQLAAARSLLSVCERALLSRFRSGPGLPTLSPREAELIEYLRLGYSNREIGAACGTSFRTVRNQLTCLFEKLEVSTRAEAVARSFEAPR